jgi:release factor glutamine methyltransferase
MSVELVAGDLFAPLGERTFHVVTANPPYVGHDEAPTLMSDVVDYEPHVALFAPGEDPLGLVRAIVDDAPRHLVPGGWLLMEIGADQAPTVLEMLETAGYADIASRQDLQGHDRVVGGRLPESTLR